MICDGIIMIHINILRVVSVYRLTKARRYHIPVPSQIMRDPKFIVNMHNKFENDLKYINYWSVCDLMHFKYSNFLHRSVSLVWGLPIRSGRHLEVSERYWMIMGIHNTLRSICIPHRCYWICRQTATYTAAIQTHTNKFNRICINWKNLIQGNVRQIFPFIMTPWQMARCWLVLFCTILEVFCFVQCL